MSLLSNHRRQNRCDGPAERASLDHIANLTRAFKKERDKHLAHEEAQSILLDMAADPKFLTDALRRHIEQPGSLNATHYPVVGLNIELNAYYGLVANSGYLFPTGIRTSRRSRYITTAICC